MKVFHIHVYMYTESMPGDHRGQKKAMNLLELELPIA